MKTLNDEVREFNQDLMKALLLRMTFIKQGCLYLTKALIDRYQVMNEDLLVDLKPVEGEKLKNEVIKAVDEVTADMLHSKTQNEFLLHQKRLLEIVHQIHNKFESPEAPALNEDYHQALVKQCDQCVSAIEENVDAFKDLRFIHIKLDKEIKAGKNKELLWVGSGVLLGTAGAVVAAPMLGLAGVVYGAVDFTNRCIDFYSERHDEKIGDIIKSCKVKLNEPTNDIQPDEIYFYEKNNHFELAFKDSTGREDKIQVDKELMGDFAKQFKEMNELINTTAQPGEPGTDKTLLSESTAGFVTSLVGLIPVLSHPAAAASALISSVTMHRYLKEDQEKLSQKIKVAMEQDEKIVGQRNLKEYELPEISKSAKPKESDTVRKLGAMVTSYKSELENIKETDHSNEEDHLRVKK